MKNSRIAQTLRSLSLKPGLESESDVDTGAAGVGQVEAAVEAAEAIPADGASAPAEDQDLSATVVVEDAGPAAEAAETTVSAESTDVDASLVTGDGEQTAAVEIAAVDETPADGASAPAEDEDLSTKQVTEDKGPSEEAAETAIEDSPVVASTESEAGEAAAEEVPAAAEEAPAAEAAAIPSDEQAAAADESTAVTGDGEEAAAVEVEAAQELPADGAAAPGEDAEVVAVVEEVAERTELESAETEVQDSQDLAVAQEAVEGEDAGAAAAAAFAAGAAGAADAAAAAAPASDVEVVVPDVAAVIEEAPAAETVEEVIDAATDGAGDAAADAAAEGAAEAVEEVAGEEAAEVVEDVIEDAAGEVADVVEEAVESELDNNDEAIAESAEIDELEEATAEGEQQVEEYEQAAATLESLIDTLHEAQQSGGMTRQAAGFYQVAFESVGIRLTGRPFQNAHGESAMPALESFGGTMRRDEATQISMENAKEWLAKVWEVIKKTFAQIKEWLIKFFQLVLDKSARVAARAAKIKAAAAKIGTDKPKAAKIKLAAASKIAINGQVSTSDINELVAFAKDAGARNQTASRAIMQLRNELRERVTQAAQGGGTSNQVSATFALTGLQGELRSSVFDTAYKGEEGEGFKTKMLPGGVEFLAIDPTHGDPNVSEFIKATFRGWKVIPMESGDEFNGEVPVLTAYHITEIANAAIGVMEAVKAAKAELKDEALSLGDLQIPDEVPSGDARMIKTIAWFTGKILQSQSSSIGKVLKYCVGTTDAYLDYAVASLKQYGAEAPAEAAAEVPAAA